MVSRVDMGQRMPDRRGGQVRPLRNRRPEPIRQLAPDRLNVNILCVFAYQRCDHPMMAFGVRMEVGREVDMKHVLVFLAPFFVQEKAGLGERSGWCDKHHRCGQSLNGLVFAERFR